MQPQYLHHVGPWGGRHLAKYQPKGSILNGRRNRRPIVRSAILALSDKWLPLDTRLMDEQIIIAQIDFIHLKNPLNHWEIRSVSHIFKSREWTTSPFLCQLHMCTGSSGLIDCYAVSFPDSWFCKDCSVQRAYETVDGFRPSGLRLTAHMRRQVPHYKHGWEVLL